jgi:hypothetical protein
MKDTALKRKKAEALYSVYKQGLEEGRLTSMRDAGRYISTQPAPCFFVSAERASSLVGRVIAGKLPFDCNESQQRMISRLYDDYMKYLGEHPGNTLSRVRIMEILVDQPAPEFYMTPDAIRRILRDVIREVRRKKGW